MRIALSNVEPYDSGPDDICSWMCTLGACQASIRDAMAIAIAILNALDLHARQSASSRPRWDQGDGAGLTPWARCPHQEGRDAP